MKKISQNQHGTLNELNITPLLDLAFVLLVIFIITTPQLSNDLEMNLPTPKKATPPGPPPKVHRIQVATTGEIQLDDQAVGLPDLRRMLVSLKASDPGTSVVVRGTDEAQYQNVIQVLDALQQAEITNVGLATE